MDVWKIDEDGASERVVVVCRTYVYAFSIAASVLGWLAVRGRCDAAGYDVPANNKE
jgi:hypothetical protein